MHRGWWFTFGVASSLKDLWATIVLLGPGESSASSTDESPKSQLRSTPESKAAEVCCFSNLVSFVSLLAVFSISGSNSSLPVWEDRGIKQG